MSRAQPSQTLFLPELPSDITDGVLERYFRGFVGYESCRTRYDRNGKLVAFVEFESIEDASRARESMQGASPFPGVNWHIHFSTNPTRDRAPKLYNEATVARQRSPPPPAPPACASLPPSARAVGRYEGSKFNPNLLSYRSATHR